MERYVPPFTINNQMLMLVAQIAEKTGGRVILIDGGQVL